MIQVELGKFYTKNKTVRYLLPVINTYSNEWKYQFKNANAGLLAVAVGDIKYDSAKGIKTEYALFMLFDINGQFDVNKRSHTDPMLGRTIFNAFLKQARKSIHHIDDYYFNPIHNGTKQNHLCCVVTKVPKKYKKSYDAFLQGAYSKMYSDDDIKELGIAKKLSDDSISPIWSVLKKDKQYKKHFEQIINDKFDTHITIEEKDERELDFPPKISEEWFNA